MGKIKKIAIFHNFLDNIGGAEIVTLILARELNADIYTTNVDKGKIIKMGFGDIIPNIKSIGRVPKNAPFKHQITQIRFRLLNLRNKYDRYIICGDWAISGAVKNKPNLWYVHSPPRELFDLSEFIEKEMLGNLLSRSVFRIWAKFNRFLFNRYKNHVSKFICNSENTRNRLKRYLGKKASVINPPIDVNGYHYKKNKDYWLSVNRLTRPKRIEMQMKAFKKLPSERLIIVGSYEKGSKHFEEYKKELERIRSKNVTLRYWVGHEELIKLYSGCKGFITTAKDEDFGMTVVEAMASGKPVIAPNEGGFKESIINGKTGKLIDNIGVNKLINAIREVGKKPEKYRTNCIKQSKNFDTKKFIQKIKEEL